MDIKKSLIGIILILIPFLHSVYKLYPEGTSELNFLGLKIEENGFLDANHALYYYLHKISLGIPLIVWFFIEKRWWKYSILSPIIFLAYQLLNGMDGSQTKLDEYEILQALPILLLLVLFLLFLSKSASYQFKFKLMYNDFMSRMEEILGEKYSYKDQYLKEKREGLQKLKQSGEKIDITELLSLKSELEKELNTKT